MKLILALALLGLAVAGCGSGTKAQTGQYVHTVTLYKKSGPVTVTGTTTISNVKTGTLIRCKRGPVEWVPPRGERAGGSVTLYVIGEGKSPKGEIQLMHLQNGVVSVACTPFH